MSKLLSDIFLNIRKLLVKNYGLVDCTYNITSPRLTINAMLKFTKVELIRDNNKYFFIEEGIRHGIITYVARPYETITPLLKNHDDSD